MSFCGESTFFHGLKVDEKGRAAISGRDCRSGRHCMHAGVRRALATPLRVFGRKEIIASITGHDHDFSNF
jgi:hypothetical protein